MKMVIRFWKMATLILGWPLISRVMSFPYFFVVYPGTQEDIEGYFPSWLIRTAQYILPPIFPIGRLGEGVVLATFNSTTEMEGSPELAGRVLNGIQEAGRRSDVLAIALAGRLPGILLSKGYQLPHPIVGGDKGTVHAVTQAVLAACEQHGLSPATPIAVLGAKGFIGVRLIEHLQDVGCKNLIAFDLRYEDERQPNGVLYTSKNEALTGAKVVVVLTAEGAQIAPQVSYLENKIIIDDTHPQLPHELIRKLQENRCTTYKMALALDGVTFDPPLPGFHDDWIPGCVCQALVEANERSAPQSQEQFRMAAGKLGFRTVLQPHTRR